MKLGVYGSALGGITDALVAKATELGEVIAERGHTIIFGACPGLPYETISAARRYATGIQKVIGYSPGVDLADHENRFKFPTSEITDFIFLPEEYRTREKGVCLKLRNVFSVEACDAAIFISGRIGTMNEFTIAYDMGRDIGLIAGTGGFSDRASQLVKELGKESKSKIVEHPNPRDIILELERLQKGKQA